MLYLTIVGGAIYLYLLYLALYKVRSVHKLKKLGMLKSFHKVHKVFACNNFTTNPKLSSGIIGCKQFFKQSIAGYSGTYIIGEDQPLFYDNLYLCGHKLTTYLYRQIVDTVDNAKLSFLCSDQIRDGGIFKQITFVPRKQKRLRFIYKFRFTKHFNFYKQKGVIYINVDGFTFSVTLSKSILNVELKQKDSYLEIRGYIAASSPKKASIYVKLFDHSSSLNLGSYKDLCKLSDVLYLSHNFDGPILDKKTQTKVIKACSGYKIKPTRYVLNYQFDSTVNDLVLNYYNTACVSSSVFNDLVALDIYNNHIPKTFTTINKQNCSLLGDYVKLQYAALPSNIVMRINRLYCGDFYRFSQITYGTVIQISNPFFKGDIYIDSADCSVYKYTKYAPTYLNRLNAKIMSSMFKVCVQDDQFLQDVYHTIYTHIISYYLSRFHFVGIYDQISSSDVQLSYDKAYLMTLLKQGDYLALYKYFYKGVVGAMLQGQTLRFYPTGYPQDITIIVGDKTIKKVASKPLKVCYDNIIYNNVYLLNLDYIPKTLQTSQN